MRLVSVDHISVICPGCRSWSDDGARIDLRTLDRAGDMMVCACGRRYPIVDGIPIVMKDPAGFLRTEAVAVCERDLAPEVAALLVEGGPDDAPYARLLEHLSIYLDAQWGDRAEPPPDGPGAGFGLAAVIGKLAALPRVDAAVELGCSVGRVLAALAANADRVVGLDLQFAAVRRARRLLGGERLAYARRSLGRRYTPAHVTGIAADVLLLCADALDPPLVPDGFDRVVALNLLDSVSSPRQLLTVADGLCAPGGELILATPYSWQSAVMAEHERLGGPAELRSWMAGRYAVEDEADLPWTLRRDARSALTYQIDYVRARKL